MKLKTLSIATAKNGKRYPSRYSRNYFLHHEPNLMLDCKGGGKIMYTFSANANVLSVSALPDPPPPRLLVTR